IRPAIGLATEQARNQVADRREITNEGLAGYQADQQPHAVVGALAQALFGTERSLVPFHALVGVTHGDFFAPHEDPVPDALRTGVTAPDAASKDRDEEQAEGANDQ